MKPRMDELLRTGDQQSALPACLVGRVPQVRQIENRTPRNLKTALFVEALPLARSMEREIISQSGRGSRQLVMVPSTIR